MKEFLEKQENGGYKLVYHKTDIDVPEGADAYTVGQGFYKNNGSEFFIDGKKWIKNDYGYRSIVLWVRPTHPEPLPFIDDNPQSLNDQYAEIEQVRQNQKTTDAMREAEGILSGKKLKGMKYDNDKPRHSLLPKGTVNAVINVLEFGAKKYEADNWQKVDNAKERYYNAAMRHIDRWWNGEKRDPETNIHHLAHAATSLFFLIWFDENGEQ